MDEFVREAHAWLRRLIGIIYQQAVQHWYNILDKELKTLVWGEALRPGLPTMLRFVFETTECIEINLLEERATIKKKKLFKKTKSVRANLPFYLGETNDACYECNESGHLRRDCKKKNAARLKTRGFCSGCNTIGYAESSYWKLDLDLNPAQCKVVKGGNAKEKDVQEGGDKKKSWKAKFAELEVKMAAMSAITRVGDTTPR